MVTVGIAVVGAGALVGALTAPPPVGVELTAVQQAAVVTTDPTPTPLLAALTSCASATGQCPDNLIATALGALVNFAAVGADGVLYTWDNIVNLGADVVANIALAPAQLGVALSTGLNLAVQNLLGALSPLAGPIATTLLDGIATLAADASAFFNIGAGGLGDAVAWKAQLDAVLADLVSTGGTALVNAVTTGLLGLMGVVPSGLPSVDFTEAAAALAVVVNHVAAGLDALMTGWDAAVGFGADIVATIGLTAADVGAALTARITDALLAGIGTLAEITGPIGAPVFTSLANLVTGVSGLITTAITIPGAALAWKAQLDAVLADLVANTGVALTNGLAASLMGMVGAVPVGLADIGAAQVCDSLVALADHVTVDLAGVFFPAAGGTPVTTPSPALRPLTTDPVVSAAGSAAIEPAQQAALEPSTTEPPVTEGTSVAVSTGTAPSPATSTPDPVSAGPETATDTTAPEVKTSVPQRSRQAATAPAPSKRDSRPTATATTGGPRHRAG